MRPRALTLPRTPPPWRAQTGTVEGVKAAALDAGGPNVALALFVGAGSANESPAAAGAAKLLEYMAFSATGSRRGAGAGVRSAC